MATKVRLAAGLQISGIIFVSSLITEYLISFLIFIVISLIFNFCSVSWKTKAGSQSGLAFI